jgi:glutaminyl-peptide cyclotransferase
VLAGMAAGMAAAILGACGPAPRNFDESRAFRHLVSQVDLGPRVPGSEGHRQTYDFMHAHLQRTADQITEHSFAAVSPIDSSSIEIRSLIGVFNEKSSRRVLFGAHWDTRLFADEETDEEMKKLPVPGANDGASGVAILLEIASQLKERPPAIGIDLAFFDGEDQGVHDIPRSFALGSQRFVKDYPQYRPAFVVILDMVGREGTRIPREGNSMIAAGPLVERIWEIGRLSGCSVLADSTGPPVFDDHIAFLEAGIPAADLIDLSDPAWHTTRDLPERCSPQSLGEVGRLVLEIIRSAERDLSP